MKPIVAPNGAKGFDINRTVTAAEAVTFVAHGYQYVARYIRRAAPSGHDLTPKELRDLLNAGLMVTLVQHVAPDGWSPNETLGTNYGLIAVQEAVALGVPFGVTLWCDLEGVATSAKPEDVIAYCNKWYNEVHAGGYVPGLYVGFGCGLSAADLYHRLWFTAYWAAYNLNMDQYPAVRGVQMMQRVARSEDLPCGFLDPMNTIDVDAVREDALLGLPVFIGA